MIQKVIARNTVIFFEHKIGNPAVITFERSQVLQDATLGDPYVRVRSEELPEPSNGRYIVEVTFSSQSYGAFSAITDIHDWRYK